MNIAPRNSAIATGIIKCDASGDSERARDLLDCAPFSLGEFLEFYLRLNPEARAANIVHLVRRLENNE